MQRKNIVLMVTGIAALVLFTAGASAFITREVVQDQKTDIKKTAEIKRAPKSEQIVWNEPRPAPQPQQRVQTCNDRNAVGMLIGGAAGGLAGHQVGKGKGKDLATIGGALGGAYVGGKYIPTQNALCP